MRRKSFSLGVFFFDNPEIGGISQQFLIDTHVFFSSHHKLIATARFYPAISLLRSGKVPHDDRKIFEFY